MKSTDSRPIEFDSLMLVVPIQNLIVYTSVDAPPPSNRSSEIEVEPENSKEKQTKPDETQLDENL